jgi:glycyl-tRNA synthetase
MEEVQKVCMSRGIVFPTAEIYPNISGFFEYGPVGFLLKKKLVKGWREKFIKPHDNIVEVEGSLILPENVLKASGHLDSFVDPITQCKKCKSIHRADHLIEDKLGKFVEGKSEKELTDIIRKGNLKCPDCGGELMDVRVFKLMLKTEISPVGGQTGYLRPETAQNIFTDFNRVFRVSRTKLPMGIAQVGKSFRNEISPRYFIVRVREFTQMEIEMFIDPQDQKCPLIENVMNAEINLLTRESQKSGGSAVKIKIKDALQKKMITNEWLAYFLANEFEFYKNLGIPEDALRFRHMLPEETPHYSGGNYDLEIKFDFGWKETVGNAMRNDHDLKSHMEQSGKDLTVAMDDGRKVVPHVVEPSFGVERTIAGILLHNFVEDKERGWNWFKFPPKIAPYLAAVFPLVKKDGLAEKATKIFNDLKPCFDVFYDQSGSIGKRYARADEIGTPFSVTIDYQTMEDGTVTVRNRDTSKQERIAVDKLKDFLWEKCN